MQSLLLFHTGALRLKCLQAAAYYLQRAYTNTPATSCALNVSDLAYCAPTVTVV